VMEYLTDELCERLVRHGMERQERKVGPHAL